VPHTTLCIHTDKNEGLTAVSEAVRLIQEKYVNEAPPSGKIAGDEKTLEQAASTLVSAAISLDWDDT
jgi:hypothetical protein